MHQREDDHRQQRGGQLAHPRVAGPHEHEAAGGELLGEADEATHDDAWEAAIVAAFHRLEKVETHLGHGPTVLDDHWSQLHRDFHMCLLAACPSERQRSLCASLFDQAERAGHIDRPLLRGPHRTYTYRDARTEAALLALRTSRRPAFETWARSLPSPVSPPSRASRASPPCR